jgi:predicted nucleic acid-binding protein
MRWILDACTLIYLIKAKLFNQFIDLVKYPVVIDSNVNQEVVIEGKANNYSDAFEAESLLNEFRIPIISINVSKDLYRFSDSGETSCFLLAVEQGVCITSDDRAYRKLLNENVQVIRLDTFYYEKCRQDQINKKEFLFILNKLESIYATKPKSILFFMNKLQEKEEDKND